MAIDESRASRRGCLAIGIAIALPPWSTVCTISAIACVGAWSAMTVDHVRHALDYPDPLLGRTYRGTEPAPQRIALDTSNGG